MNSHNSFVDINEPNIILENNSAPINLAYHEAEQPRKQSIIANNSHFNMKLTEFTFMDYFNSLFNKGSFNDKYEIYLQRKALLKENLAIEKIICDFNKFGKADNFVLNLDKPRTNEQINFESYIPKNR